MGLNIQGFVSAVIGIVVAVVVTVVIAIPVLADNVLPTTGDNVIANASSINSMLGIIPLLIVVGIIMAVVGSFLYARKG